MTTAHPRPLPLPLTLSIITPTLNRLDMLKDAVASVMDQAAGLQVEHIIVDGGSTDGTLDWLIRQPDLLVIRGPDNGIYDALNKGLQLSQHDTVMFLNSDDVVPAGALQAALAALAANPDASAVAGIGTLTQDGRRIRSFDQPGEIVQDLRTLFLGHCALNAHMFRRQTLRELGGFSTGYELIGDKHLMIRYTLAGYKTVPLLRLVYDYRRHDGSLTFNSSQRLAKHLRMELLAMALEWQTSTAISDEVRTLARVLEGRSRLGLLRLALDRGATLSGVAWPSHAPTVLAPQKRRGLVLTAFSAGDGRFSRQSAVNAAATILLAAADSVKQN